MTVLSLRTESVSVGVRFCAKAAEADPEIASEGRVSGDASSDPSEALRFVTTVSGDAMN